MSLTDDRTQTEIDERRERISALRAILNGFDDHQMVELPFELTSGGLGLQVTDVAHYHGVATVLWDYGFTLGAVEVNEKHNTAHRLILRGEMIIGKLYGNPSVFLPSSAATVALAAALRGDGPGWVREDPEDPEDDEEVPDADEEFPRDDPEAAALPHMAAWKAHLYSGGVKEWVGLA